MIRPIKRLLSLWMWLTAIVGLPYLLRMHSIHHETRWSITIFYVGALGIQILSYIRAKHLASKKLQYKTIGFYVTIIVAVGSILYSRIPSTMIMLLFPALYSLFGIEEYQMGNHVKTGDTLLYISIIGAFALRQFAYRSLYLFPENEFVNILFFIMALFQMIYMYGKLGKENTSLSDNITKIQDSSHKDPMTGLYNRSTMDTDIDKLIHQINTFCIIMFDIDNFKRVNDTYGHAFGDVVLKSLADIMKDEVKKEDRAYRYGGEEFLIVLPKTEEAGAVACANRVRKRFEETIYNYNGTQLNFTVSAGVADCRYRQYKDGKTLIEHCDAALYQAKKLGKNQVRTS